MGCGFREKSDLTSPKGWNTLAFDKDSFINFEGQKVRREMVPENYSENLSYANPNETRKEFLVDRTRPRASSSPPVASNFYFTN